LFELALLENIQRAGLTYIEEAESYKRLMYLAQIDQHAVAKKMNKSQATVSSFGQFYAPSLRSLWQELEVVTAPC